MQFQYVLYDVSKRFIYSINYTNDAGERTYALVTTSPQFAPEDVVSEAFNITELEEFVFWDLFTQQVLRLPIAERDISFTFHEIGRLSPDAELVELLDITDQDVIDDYNAEIINIHNKRVRPILDIQTELSADYKMAFTDEEMIYYMSLFNTHYFVDYNTDDTYLIKLCMLLKSTPYKLLRGSVGERDLNAAKDQWMLIVRHYIERAKGQLDVEAGLLNVESESYEYDLEEIEIIKDLLDEIPQDFIQDLDECKTYKDLLETWPPLLLPAPQFIIDHSTGRNAFTELEKRIEWRFYD